MAPNDYLDLAVREVSKGWWSRLIVRRSTADLYGWSDVYPPYSEVRRQVAGDGPVYISHYAFKPLKGCHYLRIAHDAPNKGGWPKGSCHAFRMTKATREMDLANVAKSVKREYSWMTAMWGERKSAAEWDLYQVPVGFVPGPSLRHSSGQ